VPDTYTIDGDVCITCGKCAQPDVCARGAVNLADEEEIIEEDVGVVIVATGYELCSRENLGENRVDECPDVITSLQFERLLSPSGPTAGEPKKLSDRKVPERIAFIHCAGSLCSQMSGAYLAKQAILFKKLVPHGEAYFLHGDVDTKRMNYEYLMKKAQEEAKVNYIQTEVSRIYERDGKVKILGVKSQRSKSTEIEVDMAVIALPMMSSFEVDEHGFPSEIIPKLRSVESATPGIFLVGCAQTPMDVQSTVAQAGEAASKVLEILTQMKHARKE
jgi:heterodisulfide reductase subunit A